MRKSSSGAANNSSASAHFGFLNISKGQEMTSHDVVSRVRYLTKVKQVGHASTLDRLATGVLPIAVGSACRLIRFLNTEKSYYAEVLLGRQTTTDDTEGDTIAEKPVGKLPSFAQLQEMLNRFVGTQDQIPPLYSAIHYEGKRLYELARANKAPEELKPRRVTIHKVELIEATENVLKISVDCSGGTYIRALARDVGNELEVGGTIQVLRRDRSGPFVRSGSLTLDELASLAEHDRLSEALINPLDVLGVIAFEATRLEAWQVSAGQPLDLRSLGRSEENFPSLFDNLSKHYALTFEGVLVAICERREDEKLHPEVVLGSAKSLA